MSEAPSFHDHRNVADDEWDSSGAANSMDLTELSERELSNLTSWQRAAVERLPPTGQRCLYNSWVVNDQPQGNCHRIQHSVSFYDKRIQFKC